MQILESIRSQLEHGIQDQEPLSYSTLQTLHQQAVGVLLLSAGKDLERLQKLNESFKTSGHLVDLAPKSACLTDEQFFERAIDKNVMGNIASVEAGSTELKAAGLNRKLLWELNEAELQFVVMVQRLASDTEGFLNDMIERLKNDK